MSKVYIFECPHCGCNLLEEVVHETCYNKIGEIHIECDGTVNPQLESQSVGCSATDFYRCHGCDKELDLNGCKVTTEEELGAYIQKHGKILENTDPMEDQQKDSHPNTASIAQ